jgi:glutathione synthase/RimK-type ligase-like ATP-grasp enzyme
MCVLILGAVDDDHAVFMLEHLRTRGIDAELLDSRSFPSATAMTFDPGRRDWRIRLPHGRNLRLDEIRSVYWRNYAGVEAPPLADPEQDYVAANDARGLFESFLECRQVRWVNGRRAFELHQVKPAALAMVAELGIPVPQTVLTNDPATVREFVARVPRSIFKPVQGGAHTRRVEPRHLTDDNLANLAYTPVTLQEEIPGTNLRVFVAGERAFGIEVRTGAIDFRDDERPELIAYKMPAELESRSRQIASRLELVWTGIDWRRTPEGDHYFLEANPSPMFLGFEEATGLPLTESLARLLAVDRR